MTQKNKRKNIAFLALGILAIFLILPCASEATGVGTGFGSGLPWDKALGGLANSLTGPFAQALSLIMIVVGVGVLMFGGDLAGWARWVAFAAVGIGTIGGAGKIVSILGVTGALIF